MAKTYYFNSVKSVWNKLVESDPMLGQIDVGQLCDDAQRQHRENLKTMLMLAYEAGRKHDLEAYTRLEYRINNNDFILETL